MNETPDFTFTASSAQFYQWIADNDPLMLKEIKKRVDEGRWNVVGGWWIEPDVNIPSGEALVRQGLYGQLTFQRLLGQRQLRGPAHALPAEKRVWSDRDAAVDAGHEADPGRVPQAPLRTRRGDLRHP